METYGNFTTTTLAQAITSSGQTTIVVSDQEYFPDDGGTFRVLVGSEIMVVTVVAGTTWTVQRGAEGTTATTYTTGTAVVLIITAGSIDGIRSSVHASGNVPLTPPLGVRPGDVYFPQNSFYTLQRWHPTFGWQYFLNGRLMTPPKASMFMFDYAGILPQSHPTLDNNNGPLVFWQPFSEGNQFTYSAHTTKPSAPYTITVAWLPSTPSTSFHLVGTGWRQSSSGQMILIHTNGADKNLGLLKWNAYNNNFNSNVEQLWPPLLHGPVAWVRFGDDGVNRFVKVSANSVNWTTAFSESNTTFCTPDQVMIALSDSATTGNAFGATYLTWEQS